MNVGAAGTRDQRSAVLLARLASYVPRIRILFVCDSIRPRATGVGRMSLAFLRELTALGQEMIPLDWRENEIARAVTGRCVVLPPRSPLLRTALWHFDLLARIAKRGIEHDVLLDPSGYPHVRGTHARLALFVLDLSALDKGMYRAGKRAWFRAFLGPSLAKAKALVCISEATRAQLLRRFPLDAARCTVVHLSVDAELGAKLDAAPRAARDTFLFVGLLERRKNVLGLLEAYAAARALGVRTPLVLAGRSGHGAAEILARIERPDLAAKVEARQVIGTDELVSLYARAKALLFPSFDEGFGLPILEAMRAGAPVMTSNLSSMPEVAGDAALLVDPHDVAAMRDAIVRLETDERLRNELTERGWRNLERFDAARSARALLRHLETLL